jgi:hypothetical protein
MPSARSKPGPWSSAISPLPARNSSGGTALVK